MNEWSRNSCLSDSNQNGNICTESIEGDIFSVMNHYNGDGENIIEKKAKALFVRCYSLRFTEDVSQLLQNNLKVLIKRLCTTNDYMKYWMSCCKHSCPFFFLPITNISIISLELLSEFDHLRIGWVGSRGFDCCFHIYSNWKKYHDILKVRQNSVEVLTEIIGVYIHSRFPANRRAYHLSSLSW